jgi:hypothetical protein
MTCHRPVSPVHRPAPQGHRCETYHLGPVRPNPQRLGVDQYSCTQGHHTASVPRGGRTRCRYVLHSWHAQDPH